MTKRMLIDATHAEETRVAVVDGTYLEELDVETSQKEQIKGNIYLAKVIRTEPSLQAAFVEYGGNRHGFLAFAEIHPDYYQIPVADKEKLREQLEAERKAREKAEEDEAIKEAEIAAHYDVVGGIPEAALPTIAETPIFHHDSGKEGNSAATTSHEELALNVEEILNVTPEEAQLPSISCVCAPAPEANAASLEEFLSTPKQEVEEVETADEDIDVEEAIRKPKFLKNYRIQEVIKKGQILLIQVLKEERGNKGAALTTYLSLAGRYCVLMPNTAHGGGVSRKITNIAERRQLKQTLAELKIPENMGVIVRTAGKDKTSQEIKKDYDYLIRTWVSIRDRTLQAKAPALIHEEANLVKRALRDLYSKDIDEIIIAGEKEFKYAKEFMKMLAPGMVKKISLYKNNKLPLFNRYQIENQIAMIHSPVIQLKSGGYLVINQTEALVAIDINSGRATKERTIEETALKTNLEAADEIARQLRLRDLAGLVVIDFIDMDETRNNSAVERRMKEALKKDKARVQVGRISGFGLMEMSRQRMHSSFLEASYNACPHCSGTGLVRSVPSCALAITRILEEEVYKNQISQITITVNPEVALYILNYKRALLSSLENNHGVTVIIQEDPCITHRMDYRMEKSKLKKGEETKVEETEVTHGSLDDADDECASVVSPENGKETTDTEAQEDDANPKKKRSRSNRNFYKKRGKYGSRKPQGRQNGRGNSEEASAPAASASAEPQQKSNENKEKKKGWWQKLIK